MASTMTQFNDPSEPLVGRIFSILIAIATCTTITSLASAYTSSGQRIKRAAEIHERRLTGYHLVQFSTKDPARTRVEWPAGRCMEYVPTYTTTHSSFRAQRRPSQGGAKYITLLTSDTSACSSCICDLSRLVDVHTRFVDSEIRRGSEHEL